MKRNKKAHVLPINEKLKGKSSSTVRGIKRDVFLFKEEQQETNETRTHKFYLFIRNKKEAVLLLKKKKQEDGNHSVNGPASNI